MVNDSIKFTIRSPAASVMYRQREVAVIEEYESGNSSITLFEDSYTVEEFIALSATIINHLIKEVEKL